MIKIQQLKKANQSDLADINALLAQLTSAPKALTFAVYRQFLANKNNSLLVLRDGKKLIGMATLVLMHIPTNLEAMVEDVVVDAAYRGQGLGEKLMRSVVALAKKKKVVNLGLTSRPARVAANKLYQKIGFELRDTNVYRLKLRK